MLELDGSASAVKWSPSGQDLMVVLAPTPTVDDGYMFRRVSVVDVRTGRVVERIKADVRKYLKRERRKKLPDGVDFWDFDCRSGKTAEGASEIHISGLTAAIDTAAGRAAAGDGHPRSRAGRRH